MVNSTSLIFIICSILTSGLCCDWLTNCNHLRNTTMVLIEVMGGEFTDQICPVSFPNRMYEKVENREVESQLCFIKDNLKQIFDLYRYGNLSSTSWDPVKTMHFLESINRQIYELDSCVSKLKHQTDGGLTRYYRRLKNRVLKSTDGRSAFWELLRKETKHHLDRLDLLGNKLAKLVAKLATI